MAERIVACGNSVIEQFEVQYRIELRKEERAVIRKAVRGMVNRTTLRKAYKQLFDWIDRPDLFKPKGGKLEYADVFPLIYLKMLTEGVENPYSGVKHLLVDEMQDYTPVQYAVLARLFQCRKTILGDATQSVNPYSASTPERIESVLDGAFRVTLNKSYRSTLGNHAIRARYLAQPGSDRDGAPRPGPGRAGGENAKGRRRTYCRCH